MFNHADEKTHDLSRTEAGWDSLSDAKKVAVIIDHDDQSRIDMVGGYPTDYAIVGRKVYWATLDPGKDYNRAVLEITPIAEFIENTEWLEEFWEPDGEVEVNVRL